MTDCQLLLEWKLAVCDLYGSSSTRCLQACALLQAECGEEGATAAPTRTTDETKASIMELESISFSVIEELKTPAEIKAFIELAQRARGELEAKIV